MNIKSHIAFGIGLVAVLFAAVLFLPAPVLAWNLQGACTGSPSTASVGDMITWAATQTSTLLPGQGHYEWSWSGTENLSGGAQAVQKMYATVGMKNATVIIKLVLTSGKIENITRTCSITITQPPSPATLTVIKRVVNDNGGTKTPADFMLHVKSGGTDVPGSPASGSASGVTYTLAPGTYAVSEDTPGAGYAQTGMSGDCAPNGSVTLFSGDAKTCTITNDDNPPSGGTFTGACAVTPGSGTIGSSFTWSASASGGTGTYTYSWAGDEGLTGTSQSVTKSYATSGTKNGTVVITSGNESILRSCSVTVTTTTSGCTSGCGGGFNQPNVVLLKKATSTTLASASVYISQTPQTYPSASIYLSQIPYTGVAEDNVKAIGYVVLLLAVSGILTYFISSRKKSDTHLFRPDIHFVELTGDKETSAKRSEPVVAEADVSLFVSWLVSSDSQKVFEYLRAINRRGADIAAFITNLASELDLVYRNRIDAHAVVSPEKTKKAVEGWSNKKLEGVISILVGSVDESYHSHYTAIKLAMAKIMKMGA